MGIDALMAALPDYAKDIRLNLGSVIDDSLLTEQQLWGTLLASAIAARSAVVIREVGADAVLHLGAEALQAAKAAASIMAMSNVFYRAKDLIGDEAYLSLPARLRMTAVGRPGVDRVDFKLWCLGVSAVHGCGVCLSSHSAAVVAAGIAVEVAHEVFRVAAVVHAVAVTVDGEAALGSTLGVGDPGMGHPQPPSWSR
ncbi:alkyl hydroperoxide reductase subunit D [Allocatelliglobosispora scoriae]|uniref:Alkyl hydroperoxide reductase AhpD n=1 Tax=Allocatelliglobosispora scoriae TaxID=643052 RepID=A0A841BRU7_9ACTN|nr:carboxymuconolactone decarboxylase family protein [Allocatelliglobosispora scoriae]MBB5869531.1 alkyl hydroperoxide reductase subunit D [Allocatelliglobosispora scoriae]